MYPILIQLGPITIYALWIFIALGFFAALLILNRLIQKDRPKLLFIAEHSLAVFLAGIIGARLIFVLRNAGYFFGQLDIGRFLEVFYIWDKGLSFWGGFLGIILSLSYFCRKKNENLPRWLDIIAICTLGGMVFGNIGTFLDGSNYGRETSLPWGVIIENSRYAVPIHPVQLYAAIYCLILAAALYRFYKKKNAGMEGQTALMGLAGYSFLRFLEEFLRGDESNYFLGLREAQIYCIISFVAAATIFYFRFAKRSTKI